MSAEFASPVADLGVSTMRHLRNATAEFAGNGLALDAVFRSRPRVADFGGAGAFVRDLTLQVLAADIPHVARDTSVVVTHPAATAPYYTVKQREPDDLHTGWATLVLEPAP